MTKRERLSSKVALTLLPLLLGALAGCGGAGTSTSASGGGSNGGGSTLPAGTELLYVGDNAGVIHGFAVDPNSGKLTPLATVAVSNPAAAGTVRLAGDLGGKVLYATNAVTGGPNVASFLVDQTTGTLTPSPGSPTLSVPPGKLAGGGGPYLYVIPDPSANSAQLFSFHIDAFTAALSPAQTFALPGVPNDLAIVQSSTSFWLGVAFEGASGGEIAGVAPDPTTGVVGLVPGPLTSTGGDNPQAIGITPDEKFMVAANQGTNNMAVFPVDVTTGPQTPVPGSPFASGLQPGPVAIAPPILAGTSPSAKFVFVGNTGDNSLSAYSIDPTGTLTPVTGTPIPLGANAQPSSIVVDPGGKFVYVSIAPQQIVGFAFDQTTGALTPISGSPFSVGATASDMVFVP